MPTRSCVACRTPRPKRDLVRVVRTPAGRIEIDETGRIAGRGAYLCREAGCWRTAVARGALTRALGVALPPPVRAALEAGPEALATTNTTMTTTMTGGDERGEE